MQSNEREIAVYLYCSTAVHTSRKQSILRSVDRLPAHQPFSLRTAWTAHNYVTAQPKILYSPVAPIETPPRASPNFVVQCPRSHITKTHNPIHHHHGFTRSIVLCVPFAPSQRDASNMKFCKNLQRVVDISDPEWAPYWTNYKMLKVRLARRRVIASVVQNTHRKCSRWNRVARTFCVRVPVAGLQS